MKLKLVIATTLFAIATTNALAAGKSCTELKAEIAAKLDANHVTGYVLEIVPADKAGNAKVLGTCEQGSKQIVYTKK